MSPIMRRLLGETNFTLNEFININIFIGQNKYVDVSLVTPLGFNTAHLIIFINLVLFFLFMFFYFYKCKKSIGNAHLILRSVPNVEKFRNH